MMETGYGNGIIGKKYMFVISECFHITSSGITIMDKNVKEDKMMNPISGNYILQEHDMFSCP